MSMRSMSLVGFALIGFALAACSADKGPATKLIADIQGAVDAASPDATMYVPEQLADVQTKFGALKADYDSKNYKAVVDGGAPVLSEAQGLESAATAKKDLIARGFNDQWGALSNGLPGDVSAIRAGSTS